MKKILIVTIGILITISISKLNFDSDNNDVLVRKKEIIENKKETLGYLNSYDDANIKITERDFIFNGNMDINNFTNIDLLGIENNDIDECFVKFKCIYIEELKILYMKVNLNLADDILDEISVLGYPFYNEKIRKVDVYFEYFEDEILASDLLYGKIDKQFRNNGNAFFVLDGSELGGGSNSNNSNNKENDISVNVTVPILKISYYITSSYDKTIQSEIDKLKKTTIIDFWANGAYYIFKKIKNNKAFENYENNIKQSVNWEGYINYQNKFEQWMFGFQSLDNNGCGIIALYNFLYSQDINVNLASLILLCELMDADLGLGFLGLNPIDNNTIKLVTPLVNLIIKGISITAKISSPIIAGIVTKKLIDAELNLARNWWQKALIWASLPLQYDICYKAVNLAIDALLISSTIITNFYLSNLKGIPDILSIIGYKRVEKTYLDYNKFDKTKNSSNYFIITFFNNIPNIESLKAHTIFVRKNYKGKDEFVSYNNYVRYALNFHDFFNEEKSAKQFISGIIIKE